MNIQNNAMQNLRQIMTLGNDPNALQQMVLQNNPQLRIIANQMQQSNLTPTQYIMQMAKQNNIPLTEQMVENLMQSLKGIIPQR
jgi:hypothetical protein